MLAFTEAVRRYPGGSPGQVGMAYNSKSQRTFGAREWRHLVENGGDFQAIGIKVTTGNPVPGVEEYIAAVRRDRLQVRPKSQPSEAK
jgi:hypothetical protein